MSTKPMKGFPRGGLMIHWQKKATSEFDQNFNENDENENE